MVILKRGGAIFLAICILLSMSLNALANNTARGSEKTGSIIIHKYEGDAIELKHDGTEITATDDKDGVLDKLTSLNSIEFTVTRMFLVKNPQDGITYYKDEHDKSYVKDETFVKKATTANHLRYGDGTAIFDNLPLGIYYVEETVEDKNIDGSNSFFVHIPIQDPMNPDGYLYDVHVYPKNTKLVIDKELIEPEIGTNIVTWRISVTVPNAVANGKSYIVTDELDSRLDYVENTLVITDGNKTITDYFEITYPAGPGGTIEMKLKKEYLEDLAVFDEIFIELDTMIVIDDEEEVTDIENKASVEFINAIGEKFIRDPMPFVTPYGIRILKYGNNNKDNRLDGAVFKIYDVNNTPVRNPNGSGEWTVTTDKDGYARFYGLTEGTFYLHEIKAPKGYKLLTKPIEVTVGGDQTPQDYIDNIVEIKVNNAKGINIPKTGGMDTLWFIIIGLLLVIASLITYIISEKKKEQKA